MLAICHGGDPTADEDRRELERARLSLQGSVALPDLVMLDARDGVLWLVEIVVTGGAITEGRRDDLLRWAAEHGFRPEGCRLVAVVRSRSEPVFRRVIGTLAWRTLVWLADEAAGVIRLEELPPLGP